MTWKEIAEDSMRKYRVMTWWKIDDIQHWSSNRQIMLYENGGTYRNG